MRVVKAANREVGGHVQVAPMRDGNGGGRHVVIAGENSGGRIGQFQQRLAGDQAGTVSEEAWCNERFVTLDASIGGIGGCPFAPAATGNIATEDLRYMLGRMGVETGVSIDELIATSRWLEQQLGAALPGMLMKAGSF